MKNIIVVSFMALAITAYGYSTRYDDLDIEAIVANKEALQSFLDCFIDKKPCNDLTRNFKNKLPEIIEEACAKCNPTQKHKFKIFLDGLKVNLPEEYAELKKKFDPSGNLFEALRIALIAS